MTRPDRKGRWAIVRWLGAWAAAAALIAGCHSGGQTTRLTQDDFDTTTIAMAESLRHSTFLAERSPDSPEAVIMIDSFENRTSDIIPPVEQWMLMARLRGSLPVLELSKQKNLVFLIPPDRQEMLRQTGYDLEFPPQIQPTHKLEAVCRSATRAGRDGKQVIADRLDSYYLEYRLTSMDGQQLWSDAFEFAREAKGNILD
jgi:hypothetical protein